MLSVIYTQRGKKIPLDVAFTLHPLLPEDNRGYFRNSQISRVRTTLIRMHVTSGK